MSPDQSGGRAKPNDQILPQALAALTVAVLVDLNFLGLPRLLIETAGRDAWISVVIGFFIALGAVALMFALLRRFPGQTLVEMSNKALGRFFGSGLVLLYVLFWTLSTAATTKMQSHLFTRALLPNTPPTILTASMLLLAVYLARHGIEPMSRLFLLFLVPFLFTLPPISLLTVTRSEWARLLPLLENGWAPVLKGVLVSYGGSHGLEFLLMMGAFLPTLRGGFKASAVGTAFVITPAVFITLLLVARFGTQGVIHQTWPTLSLVTVAEVPGFTGFRLDPIFLTVWTLFVFASIAIRLFLVGLSVQRMFRLPGLDGPVFVAGAVFFALSAIPVNPLDILSLLDRCMHWLAPLFTLALPSLLLAVSIARSRGSSGS